MDLRFLLFQEDDNCAFVKTALMCGKNNPIQAKPVTVKQNDAVPQTTTRG